MDMDERIILATCAIIIAIAMTLGYNRAGVAIFRGGDSGFIDRTFTDNHDGYKTEHARYMYGSDRYPITANIGSRTWITPTKTATLMKRIVDALVFGNGAAEMDAIATILDMTGNCGGNILPFVDDDRYTGTAYEIDKKIYAILKANISAVAARRGDDRAAFTVRNESSLTDDGTYDVIIVDPPFGDEYKTDGILYQPHLGDMNMSQLVHHLHGRTRYLVMKLPMKGFDIDGFVGDVQGDVRGVTVYDPAALRAMDGNVHKILLIVIEM